MRFIMNLKESTSPNLAFSHQSNHIIHCALHAFIYQHEDSSSNDYMPTLLDVFTILWTHAIHLPRALSSPITSTTYMERSPCPPPQASPPYIREVLTNERNVDFVTIHLLNAEYLILIIASDGGEITLHHGIIRPARQ
mmetsp:Transcript_16124/g.19095  ORF Transcript_16124/g.19095 Transcript_16124/m.19095 type:complete len:138 (+) Transcript_16124:86-499(+)